MKATFLEEPGQVMTLEAALAAGVIANGEELADDEKVDSFYLAEAGELR